MYKNYFHLSRNPFDLTPDPNSFVPTPRHNEALAALYYGVRQHKGFVVVTGEVGTGKTLLLRCLLRLLRNSKDIVYAYLFNSRLSPMDFLQYILADFGLPASGKSKADMLLDLSKFLVTRGRQKMTTVLIVDEAHDLPVDTLEELRLLSNLETTDDKLLQIILVGQPELDKKLDSFELRQLKQRVALRTSLGALTVQQTQEYIEQRLVNAGADPANGTPFSPQAVEAIYSYSHGLPRIINILCENALLSAYAKETQTVTPRIIEDVASEFRLESYWQPEQPVQVEQG
jgi:general secretion pathway protein A